jgi:hypothetical protein
MLRRAAARAAAECGRVASLEAASCSGRARSLSVGSALPSPVAFAAARTHLLPLSVRLALAEARAAAAAAAAGAGRAGEGRLVHTFQARRARWRLRRPRHSADVACRVRRAADRAASRHALRAG